MLTFLLAIENISLIRAAPLFSISVNSAPEAKTKGNHFTLPMSLQRVFFQFQTVQKEEHPVTRTIIINNLTITIFFFFWIVTTEERGFDI